jgi:hypothetical protein
MYSTPATGSGPSANDLEDYLLGKKRVDKILTGDENDKVSPLLVPRNAVTNSHSKVGASHKNFIATQFANTIRDTAAKVREDPLLAIKQQEQAAYQALMSNPLRLKQLQEKNGIKAKKDKEKKKHKEKGKHRSNDRSRSRERTRYRSRSRSPHRRSRDDYSRSRRSPSPHSRHSRRRSPSYSPRDDHRRRRDRSIDNSPRRRRSEGDVLQWPRSDESDEAPSSRRYDDRSKSSYDDRKRQRSQSPRRWAPPPKRSRASPPPLTTQTQPADDRAARLAAMSSNATEMSSERQEHLKKLLEQEKREMELEQVLRAKSKGMGGFLSQEQKKVFGGSGDLEERLRRGRAGLVSRID